MLWRVRDVALPLGLVLVLSACAGASSGSLSGSTLADPDRFPLPDEYDIEPIALAEVLYTAHVLIEGDVVAVGEVQWNQASGGAWDVSDEPETLAEPMQYQIVTLGNIVRLRQDPDTPILEDGRSVDIVSPVVVGQGGETELLGGEFRKGDHVIVALYYSFFGMREGYVDRFYPVGYQAGVFFANGADYERRLTVVPAISASDARAVEGAEFAEAEVNPIERTTLLHLADAARREDRTDWDMKRQGVSATEQTENVRALVAQLTEEAKDLRQDPENICNWVGDPARAAAWIDRHPESGRAVDEMVDPAFVEEICGGYQYEGPPIDYGATG